jgi:hypothetical protein
MRKLRALSNVLYARYAPKLNNVRPLMMNGRVSLFSRRCSAGVMNRHKFHKRIGIANTNPT